MTGRMLIWEDGDEQLLFRFIAPGRLNHVPVQPARPARRAVGPARSCWPAVEILHRVEREVGYVRTFLCYQPRQDGTSPRIVGAKTDVSAECAEQGLKTHGRESHENEGRSDVRCCQFGPGARRVHEQPRTSGNDQPASRNSTSWTVHARRLAHTGSLYLFVAGSQG